MILFVGNETYKKREKENWGWDEVGRRRDGSELDSF